MIDLWTVYFEVMQEYLDGLLDILVACICQGKSTRLESTKSTRGDSRSSVRWRMIADLQKTIPLLESVLHVSNNSLNPMYENFPRLSGRVSFPLSFSCLLLQLHISCLIRNCMLRLNLIIWMNRMVSQARPSGRLPIRLAVRPFTSPRPAGLSYHTKENSCWYIAPFQKFVAPAPLPRATSSVPPLPQLSFSDQRRIFKQIIVKCVLQLLLIETTHELLQNDEVYNTIPAEHLLRFMGVLDDSWRFARKFNADRDLRMKLWKVGMSPLLLDSLESILVRVTRLSREIIWSGRETDE